MILADKIILERKKNGWSQEDLANKLGVSRQAVSKWEGAQTTPDLLRILEMSKLFGVTVDYLLKDELEEQECIPDAGEDNPSVRRVSMDEANEFLSVKRKTAPQIALATMLCILSPIPLFLLSVGAESGKFFLSEAAAGGIGVIILLAMVAVACSVFISCGMKTKAFEFLEKEIIETEYGVVGMVKERKRQYEEVYTKYNIAGTVICILGVMVLLAGTMFGEDDFIMTIFLCLMLAVVSVGVRFFLLAGINQASFHKLLQEGEYSIKEKTKSPLAGAITTIYWLVVTAVFLALGFKDNEWNRCALIWPIAGVLFPAVLALVKIFEKSNS